MGSHPTAKCSHFLWFLPLLQLSAVTHTPLAKWPLDTPMVVSSLVLTTAMVSCLELEPLETEESSTLDSMVFIILENVRLNLGPLDRLPLEFPLSTLPWTVVFTTQVWSLMSAMESMDTLVWVTM